MVRVDARSRAAILLRSGAVLRLDQNTTITFGAPRPPDVSWLELLIGAVHFISRVTRGLNVQTPFVNAAVEGTEFWIEVTPDQAAVTVLEGRITASNAGGSLTLERGQAAVAQAGQAPVLRALVVTPSDAVQWALYYPPLLTYAPADFPDRPGETWPELARRSVEQAARGDLEGAFATLAGVPPTVVDPRFLVYRAGLSLSVGRVDEALPDLERALALDPRDSQALALRAIVAVARNDDADALRLAEQAVQLAPRSAAARLALSYAQQARVDLEGALGSAREAVTLEPGNALAHARLAELLLSVGRLDAALAAAAEAVRLDPGLARAHTVLGFAYLTQIRLAEAAATFERAIQLDQAAPLPRLGLGLTKIRRGELEAGRQELEIAVSLDPADSLLRSYLGKAFYEEKRTALASEQFTLAQTLDAQDPTPWLYQAIQQQSVNRPVEALESLQRSIELNDNRAVYRSRLLLDEDLAARSASLARIYDDLGFQQLAFVEGWKSLNVDPANHSAHRFLSDSYSVLPRHEVARVSELLQAQLLQPLNLIPVEPQLAASKLFILAGAEPTNPAFNEFNALFERNRISLYASGVAGTKGTFGDSLTLSALWDKLSMSVGQFHFETDGFRANNDLKEDIYNVFVQASPSHRTSVLAEFRAVRLDQGDIIRFDPDRFLPTRRDREDTDTVRLGFRHAYTPGSVLIAAAAYGKVDATTVLDPDTRLDLDDDGFAGEAQHLLSWEPFHVITGFGHFEGDRKTVFGLFGERLVLEDRPISHTNLYLYSSINYPKPLVTLLGASGDLFDGVIEREQVNPKLGLTWTPLTGTTLRAAAFRVLKRSLVSSQTIEPTQVAGFNQFFDDPEGTTAWRYGVALDQVLSRRLYVGAELSRRDLKVPFTDLSGEEPEVRRVDWREDLGRAYAYGTPHPWLVLSAEYYYERLRRDADFVGEEEILKARTHRVPLGIGVFHPSGLIARLKATYAHQSGDFGDPVSGTLSGSDDFWVLDAALAYRLPRRWGLISLEAKNLLDERFRYQELDPARPLFSPERLVLLKLTLVY